MFSIKLYLFIIFFWMLGVEKSKDDIAVAALVHKIKGVFGRHDLPKTV